VLESISAAQIPEVIPAGLPENCYGNLKAALTRCLWLWGDMDRYIARREFKKKIELG
jgi:hypothetical protein